MVISPSISNLQRFSQPILYIPLNKTLHILLPLVDGNFYDINDGCLVDLRSVEPITYKIIKPNDIITIQKETLIDQFITARGRFFGVEIDIVAGLIYIVIIDDDDARYHWGTGLILGDE